MEVAAYLHVLCGKNSVFRWNADCESAFVQLKSLLSSSPILCMPTDTDNFILDTDASGISLGAVLSQVQNGTERVVAFASRVLSPAERTYCVRRCELLAVVHFCKYFRQYLLGRRFLIRTNHSTLRWLWSTPEPIGQQARWCELLRGI